MLPTSSVKSTVETYVNAVTKYDAQTLSGLLAKDYLEVSPLGEVDNREKVLSFYRVPKDQRGPVPTGLKLSEWNIRYLGKSTAIVVFREDLQVIERKMSFRFTMVMHRTGVKWQLISNHVNGIRSKS
jgi:hypothetical protein